MALYKLAGRAKNFDGAAIDYVSVFNWIDGKCIGQVKPNASGAWVYRYGQTARVGVTYVADGCEPITHGAYDIPLDPLEYKWWRITNIVGRTDLKNISVAEIRFNNEQGVVSNNPAKGFANSFLTDKYLPSNAFDGNTATFAHCVSFEAQLDKSGKNWAIGYHFDNNVKVTSVSVQMRPDMQPNFGQEWQTADIEFSDDGVIWIKCGTISPSITTMDLSLITTPIILD